MNTEATVARCGYDAIIIVPGCNLPTGFVLAFALVEYLKIPCLVRHSTSKFSVHVRSSWYRGKLSLTAIELSELNAVDKGPSSCSPTPRVPATAIISQRFVTTARSLASLLHPYPQHWNQNPNVSHARFREQTFSSCCTSIYGKLLVHDTSLISFLPLLTSRTHTSCSFEFILAYISVQYSAAAFRSILLIQKCHLYGHFLSPRCRWLRYQSLKRLPNQVRPFTTK